MREQQRQANLQRARALAEKGETAAAVAAFSAAGEPAEGARLLIALGKAEEAAGVLLKACGVSPGTRHFTEDWVKARSQAERRLLTLAAICFKQAGELDTAVELFNHLGERERAIQALRAANENVKAARLRASGRDQAKLENERRLETARRLESEGKLENAFATFIEAGAVLDAARVALSLEDFAQAAKLFTEAREDLRAANAWEKAGDLVAALRSYIDVPQDHAHAEAIADRIADLACRTNTLDHRIDARLQDRFLVVPDSSDAAERRMRLARLYAAHDYPDTALELVDSVLEKFPAHPEALEFTKKLALGRSSDKERLSAILQEEERFRRASSQVNLQLPEHDALPDLPDGFTSFTQSALARARRRIAGDTGTEVLDPIETAPAPTGQQVAARTTSPQSPDLAEGGGEEVYGPLKLEAGRVIAGRYRLEKELGVGGMAVVYAAHDTDLEERVALKIFTQPVDDEVMLKRFKQELLLSRRLNHPNILRLYDIGTVQGRRFISMELLKGRDMSDFLSRPVNVKLGIDWLVQACEGLHAAHEAGVVHRDIKPHNLFVCDDGCVKVMDFGIAKNPSTNLTTDRMIAGTPDYMSPEQINGFSSVGPSTDIYALGISAFELFCGRLPFVHDETVPLLLMHVGEPPPRPRTINPNVPESLEKLLLHMLEKDPAHRPPTCLAVRDELKRIRQQLGR